jgi:hypothetical protein
MVEWLQNLPDWDAEISEFLGAKYDCESIACPVIRWDNYLSIYLHEYGQNLKTLRFLTHNEGDPPDHRGTMFSDIWDLPYNLSHWLNEEAAPWIVNIDLDYFYCETSSGMQIMVSEEYLTSTFRSLKEAIERGVVGVVTICLTPDTYTAGWESTEELVGRILSILGLDFQLPAS